MSGIVRISVGNLLYFVDNGQPNQVALLDKKKLDKGVREAGALGGGAMLTPSGKEMLEASFGASNFEYDEKTGFFDARFHIEEQHVESVLALFADLDGSKQWEQERHLDFMHEVVEAGIVSETDILRTSPLFVETKLQRPAELGADTSARATIPTRRLFRIYSLVAPFGVAEKFLSSSMIVRPTKEDLATTNGGSTAGVMSDGTRLKNNLFL